MLPIDPSLTELGSVWPPVSKEKNCGFSKKWKNVVFGPMNFSKSHFKKRQNVAL